METREPPEFEQMSKKELIANAMLLEEADIRRCALGVDLIGAVQANVAQFKRGDDLFLCQLAGKEPPPILAPARPSIKIEEREIVKTLNGIYSSLQKVSREELMAHIGRLRECEARRTALFHEWSMRLADDCIAFGGANATLSQAIGKPKKGH